MPAWAYALLAAAGLLVLGGIAYWQLIIAEGAYLGQRVVTWLYDIAAPRYDAIKQFDEDMEAAFLGRPLAGALRRVPGPLVLDVATGSGRLPLALFAQPSFRGQVIGVDASRPMLRLAADKLKPDAHRLLLIWRDAIRLPFRDGTFDAVTVLEMLEFTPDPAAQLEEAIRVLRPGGVLLTTRRRGWNAAAMPGKTHSPAAFRALLEGLGLLDVDIQPWQVEYDLVWARKAGQSISRVQHPLTVLCCPACGASEWREDPSRLVCTACGRAYPVNAGLVEMDCCYAHQIQHPQLWEG